MNLSIRHLRAFTALASARNFTRAAELCNLTQSAFSALISNLENGLGVRLFSRNTRNVELTAEGRVFEKIATRLLPDMERALLEMRDHVERKKGRLAIAALPSISSGMLPKLVRRFQTRYPGIDLAIQDVANTICLDLVRARHVDLALCAAVSPSPDLAVEKLGADTFHFVCPKHHALAARGRLTAADLLDEPIIVFESNSSIRQHLDACIYPRRWTVQREVHNLSTAAALVGAGLGVTIVPTIALVQFDMRSLRAVPVKLAIEERAICLIRRKDADDSMAAQAFIELLRDSMEQEIRDLASRHAK